LNGKSNFKSWLNIGEWALGKRQRPPDKIFNFENTVEHIANWIKREGPFDGILAFSQGGIAYRHFHKFTQTTDPEAWKDVIMPKFMISVACPVVPYMDY
jgi:hypothetical protein